MKILGSFVFILFLSGKLWAEEGLFVAGIDLKLGMEKEHVLSTLQSKYKLTEPLKDTWFIFTKEGSPYELIGQVGFKGGKLNWISKNWGSYPGDTTLEFAKELYSVLSNIQNEANDVLSVSVRRSFSQPGSRGDEINFVSGNRKVIVIIVDGSKSGKQVSIQEDITGR